MDFQILKIESNLADGCIVSFKKKVNEEPPTVVKIGTKVNVKTTENINFTRGFIISKEIIPHWRQNEKDSMFVVYKIEFLQHMPNNFSQLALGGRDPTELMWQIEIEPFSSYGSGIMRNNVF